MINPLTEWNSYDYWIIAIGILASVSCAIPGCFLLLRRMSMMGDAISHAVLPGLAMAFIITGTRTSLVMFMGAAVVGVLTAVFTQWISRFGKVDRGAAMGIVFTTLFALGLLLIERGAGNVDLDADCVLYGAIELTPVNLISFAGMRLPEAVVVLGAVLILNISVVLIFFKELKICSFDPGLAETVGIPSEWVNYGLMMVVAVTTVACFEVVGSIIVIAMLIVPAATAYLLTHKLVRMIWIACGLAAFSAVAGHAGAGILPTLVGFDSTTTSGMMAVAAGLFFLIIWAIDQIVRHTGNKRKHLIDKPGDSLE